MKIIRNYAALLMACVLTAPAFAANDASSNDSSSSLSPAEVAKERKEILTMRHATLKRLGRM